MVDDYKDTFRDVYVSMTSVGSCVRHYAFIRIAKPKPSQIHKEYFYRAKKNHVVVWHVSQQRSRLDVLAKNNGVLDGMSN